MCGDPRHQLARVWIIVMRPRVLLGGVPLQTLVFVPIIGTADDRVHEIKANLLAE
jgi:hypothetical protein